MSVLGREKSNFGLAVSVRDLFRVEPVERNFAEFPSLSRRLETGCVLLHLFFLKVSLRRELH